MKLQIVSDVHVELLKTNNFSEIQLKPKADTVVLLGDIGCPSEETYIKYVNFYINNYKKVFIIAGNHEFYHGEYHSTKQKIIELFSQVEKVTFLDRTSILHENVRFLGCTLWSYVNEHDKRTVETTLGDYYEIELKKNDKILKIKVEDTNFFHEIELKWLKSEIKNAEKNGEVTVVLTHHAPVFEGVVDPKHVGSSLGCAFSTYLNNMLGGNIAAWCFGHTHYSSSQLINGKFCCLKSHFRNTGNFKSSRYDTR